MIHDPKTVAADERRLLLRAEVDRDGGTLVARTSRVSLRSIFVETRERIPLGELVTVRLSLPTLVRPLERQARVGAHATPGAPGDDGGMRLDFERMTDAERAEIAGLLDAGPTAALADDVPPRVLLVEDSALIRDMFTYGVARYFKERKSAVEIDHASDGRHALDALGAAHYDLVIVDYYMPVLDGAGFISALRNDPAHRAIPVVAISVGGEAARKATLDAGADLFIDKPLVLRDLFELLSKLAPRFRKGAAERRTT